MLLFFPIPVGIRTFLIALITGLVLVGVLNELLASDSTAWADGGGKARAIQRPVFGRVAVARLILGITRKLPPDLSGSIEEVNGSPAFVARTGSHLHLVLTFDVIDDHIKNLYTIRNPDKLLYLQNQLAKRPPA